MTRQIERSDAAPDDTAVHRQGERELIVTRTFDAPPPIVFRAWSEPELFQRWWVPKSATGVSLLSCEMDVRTGGTYRLEFGAGGADSMAFYGKYLDVVPNERIVWTNDEGAGGDAGQDGDAGAVTTVTFAARDGRTLLTFHELYPSPAALEEALKGAAAGLAEQLDQLGALLSGVGT